MDQWKKLIASLSVRQRVMIAATAIVIAGGLLLFTRWRHDSGFTPLFTGMSSDDAGSVVQKLKESGVEYKIKEGEGTTILVSAEKLAELRLEMAAAGLPKTGRAGFELFDRTNLGTTDFAEHINYARAVEGELERSIRYLREVDQARVHLTFPKDSVFLDSKQPAKASVLLSLKPGAKISAQNVVAICHLVSSAVEGLTPEVISVLDARGTLLSRPKNNGPESGLPDQISEYREKLEQDMLAKINSTLGPLLGDGRFRASVAIDCDLTSGEESQEKYDPAQTVMLNSTKTEETSGASAAAGLPGTASNLPRPVKVGGGAGTSTLRRSETIGYQPSKTVRHTRIPQGTVKRVSAALLIDHAVRWENKDGKSVRTLVPPSAETLKSIRELTTAVMGLNVDRGDQLVVETLPFESTLNAEPVPVAAPAPNSTPGAPGFSLNMKDKRVWIGAGAIGLVVFATIGLVVKRKLRKKKQSKATAGTQPALEGTGTTKAVEDTTAQDFKKSLEGQVDRKRKMLADAQEKLNSQPIQTRKSEVLISHLTEAVQKDPAGAATILREFLHD